VIIRNHQPRRRSFELWPIGAASSGTPLSARPPARFTIPSARLLRKAVDRPDGIDMGIG
jgi:hypothetical protein